MKRHQSNNVQNSGSNTVALDAKPMRTLAPMFPSTNDINAFTVTNNTPFVYVNSSSLSVPSKRSSQSKLASPISKPKSYKNSEDYFDYEEEEVMPSFHTSASGRKIKQPDRLGGNPEVASGSRSRPVAWCESETGPGSPVVSVPAIRSGSLTDGTVSSQSRKNIKKPIRSNLAIIQLHHDPKEAVEVVRMTFEAIWRKLSQLDDIKVAKCSRPDLKAGTTLMGSDLRANSVRRIGHVSGVEIGDMFYYRIEMCLVGLHAPAMGGIDYMTTIFEDGNDTVALSVVLGGVYDNEDTDVDSLIYTGQGDPHSHQKLLKGNLALERSLHRGNLVRVIRSTQDYTTVNGKIYFYDGLYKVEKSWVEKSIRSFKVFKFKLARQPDQPHGLAIWKMTQQWKDKPETRDKVIICDLSSGIENLPVCLVNEIDDEKGPRHFKYSNKVEYLWSFGSNKPLEACGCHGVCLPGGADCLCTKKNGGVLPYSSSGSLVIRKPLIYECNASCCCNLDCRNRGTQKGIKLQFEVFKTRDRGWGLRSWDPIRAGTFICEYTGEVINKVNLQDENGEDGEYIFQAIGIDEKPFKWNYGPELLGESGDEYPNETLGSLPIVINAKNMGNLSRFMNHSCSPNVFWQPVLYDHGDEMYPHIMFFALKHIPPLTELTYDYGMSAGAGPRKTKECLCGSSKCRGLFG